MSKASDLIERMECETGQRIDDNNSFAMAGLFGAITRLMGRSSHQERDDVAAGVLIQHQTTSEHHNKILESLLKAGLSPDEIRTLTRHKRP